MLFQHLLRCSHILSVFSLFTLIDFQILNQTCFTWLNLIWSWYITLFRYCWIWFAKFPTKNFPSVFMRNIYFLSWYWNNTSYYELYSIFLPFHFLDFCIISLLIDSLNFLVKLSGPSISLVWMFLDTYSILKIDIGIFRLSIPFSMSFGTLSLSINLSVLSVSNLLI